MVVLHSVLAPALPIKAASPIHPASLVPAATHSDELLSLVSLHPASSHLIDHLVALTTDTVTFALSRALTNPAAATFPTFVKQVIHRASLATPVLLSAMVYIARAKKYLSIAHEEWALERVFLGAVVVASKYLNDSCLKNHHWSTITQTFGTRDIGRIEREWCAVLDFEFAVSEGDLMAFYPALAPYLPSRPASPASASVPAKDKKTRRKESSPTPFEYGAFDILPSDVHSPSSDSEGSTMFDEEDRRSPYTPSTSPFSPGHHSSHSHHAHAHQHKRQPSASVPEDVEDAEMAEQERRGRPREQTKSALTHRATGKFQIVAAHPRAPSDAPQRQSHHSMASLLKAFPMPLPVRKVSGLRPRMPVRVS